MSTNVTIAVYLVDPHLLISLMLCFSLCLAIYFYLIFKCCVSVCSVCTHFLNDDDDDDDDDDVLTSFTHFLISVFIELFISTFCLLVFILSIFCHSFL